MMHLEDNPREQTPTASEPQVEEILERFYQKVNETLKRVQAHLAA